LKELEEDLFKQRNQEALRIDEEIKEKYKNRVSSMLYWQIKKLHPRI